MGIISDLTPLNLEEEKRKFWGHNFDYNPQFVYQREFSEKKLQEYGLPKKELVEKGWRVINEQRELLQNENGVKELVAGIETRHLLSEAEVVEKVVELQTRLGVPLLKAVFDPRQTARCMLSYQEGLIKFRSPLQIDEPTLRQILNHEIQTHYLRRLNEQKQPWAQEKRSKHLWKKTEEGLAVYNSFRAEDNSIRLSIILRYLLVDEAQRRSFKEIFALANEYYTDPERAWFNTTRVKRGLADTSLPGGFTKDLIYYEGLLEIERWLEAGGQINDLYWGKIGWQEIEELRGRAVKGGLFYPIFEKENANSD